MKKEQRLEIARAGEAAPARVDFGEVIADVAGASSAPPAEMAARVKSHLAAAAMFSRLSLAHAIAAGWLLHVRKIHTPYGMWQSWCREALGVSHKTADRYIGLFRATVGAARETDGIPFENSVTERELEFATTGMENKTVTRAMAELGVVRRQNDDEHPWGGDRSEKAAENGRKVGRPPESGRTPAETALRDWAPVLVALRRLGKTSFGYLPLDAARGCKDELDAASARLKARIGELESAAGAEAELAAAPAQWTGEDRP